MNNQPISTGEINQPIMAAIRRVLRPLVRMLLSHGVTYQIFSDIVKSVYVKVSEEEFMLANKTQTDSRISLLTGIHRREVNRLRNETVSEVGLSQRASMSALLLTIWSGTPDYLDAEGQPISLPRLAKSGDKPSFEGLVQSVSKDFRARVVLDEWVRQGIVTVDRDDNVHLVADAFATPQDMEEKIYYFNQNIHDHLAATVHNLTGNAPPFLERCVYYDKLSAESVKALSDYTRTVGMRGLHAVNRRAAELQKHDQGRADAEYRFNFGVYNFSEVEAGHEHTSSDAPTD